MAVFGPLIAVMPGLHGLRGDAGRVLCKGGEFLFEGVAILFILKMSGLFLYSFKIF